MASWERFVKRARLPTLDMYAALRNLHLLHDDQMTQAGAWLLTEDITGISRSATVTCALFQGTDKVHILDRKEYTGDLYSIYGDCMAYLQSKLTTALIPHATGRDERLELPVEALREALVNSIVHRDYRSTANVQVYIFQDRVEIVTPPAVCLPECRKKIWGGQKVCHAIRSCLVSSSAWGGWLNRSAVVSGGFARCARIMEWQNRISTFQNPG
ncbi:hypothetical protein [Methanogenium cariaci]|uniref:hypothetical protein n=1 Tax=Methanogenium cariaci TaxID=2197 RepID=UPI000781DA57|nr:hypothetical protein [Methanogenium cariaci]